MLVAPLNWGLGHAARCIPIINALLKANFEPIIASDGEALLFLKKEFPTLKSYQLPSYNISYSKKGWFLKFKLLFNAPNVIWAVIKEKKITHSIVEKENLAGIISDNRFGVYHKNVPSVFITHQIRVLSGFSTFLTSKIHQKIIEKFNECWVPDLGGNDNLSGVLSHSASKKINPKYLGIISRFTKQKTENQYSILVLLSGPEPQRTMLEKKLLLELKNYEGKILFIRGIFSETVALKSSQNFIIKNYLLVNDLEQALNISELVICRSGYTTLLDLASLQKKAFFIPTPGQFEQEYLARYLESKNIAPFAYQNNFTIDLLQKVKNYSGFIDFKSYETEFNLDFFHLFNGK